MFCSWMFRLVFLESSRFQIGVANNEMADHALCPVWSSTIVQECSEAIRDILVTPHKSVQKTKRQGEKNTSTWHCLYKALFICDCTGTEKAQERHSNSQRRVSRESHSGQAMRLSPLSSVTHCCTHCLPLNLYETRPFASLFSLTPILHKQ